MYNAVCGFRCKRREFFSFFVTAHRLQPSARAWSPARRAAGGERGEPLYTPYNPLHPLVRVASGVTVACRIPCPPLAAGGSRRTSSRFAGDMCACCGAPALRGSPPRPGSLGYGILSRLVRCVAGSALLFPQGTEVTEDDFTCGRTYQEESITASRMTSGRFFCRTVLSRHRAPSQQGESRFSGVRARLPLWRKTVWQKGVSSVSAAGRGGDRRHAGARPRRHPERHMLGGTSRRTGCGRSAFRPQGFRRCHFRGRHGGQGVQRGQKFQYVQAVQKTR